MLEFKDACQDLFAQLLTDAPQWTEWMVEVNPQPITIGYFDGLEEAYPLVLLAIREGKKPG
ncbi:hypothetical protein [Nostoc sp. LEGE 12450]|jgi:hypothetical protein|uniref:hypothetical protein n=1 Tax=Nostoc sp. LEGE 12450 TaxID=1828643 RepID=UPI0018804B7B|nr:hypothetical protein [Nostoc sp. LEGE 12450]MBE8990426.1 hypothetical protein [Nostoc sp. LEGE 12450]